MLDLTRLVSRQGRGAATGIDRVEAAYLRRFLADPLPVFGLVRTALGYLVLDRPGVALVQAIVRSESRPSHVDLLSRLARRAPEPRAAAETALRASALARVPPPLLPFVLRRCLPAESQCYLVGHSDLSPRVLDAMHRVKGTRVNVLLHDTIPLDHPEFSRPDEPKRFRARLRAVAHGADRVLCTTRDVQARAARHLAHQGRVPPITVAPLGLDISQPDSTALPAALQGIDPFLLCVGTIEPRKNHALLLDLWETMHATLPEQKIPHLVLAGSRGWRNEAVFHRLDSLPFIGRTVLEMPGLSDGAIAALMQRARALVCPSLAEGFGLAPVEALANGLPVIASALAVRSEVLGDSPRYVAASDHEGWLSAIQDSVRIPARHAPQRMPSWDDHFNLVLNDG